MEENQNVPSQYRVLSAWAYFGYNLLFSIPIVGFICAIIFAFDDSNLNRRSFARSYFCGLLIAVIVIVIFAIIFGAGLASFSAMSLKYY